jgi:hypothetical protein
MKLIVLLFVLTSALSTTGKAQQEDPRKALTGQWAITTADIRQDSLGTITPIVYNISEGSKHGWAIYTPLKFAANGDCDLTLAEDVVEEGTFTVKGDQLEMQFILLAASYTYQIENDQLHLYKQMAFLRGYPAVEVFWTIHLIYQLKKNEP